MRTIWLLPLVFLSIQALADEIEVGCADLTYTCLQPADGKTHCFWNGGAGTASAVELEKAGDGPNSEVWRGQMTGKALGKYPYTLEIDHRREAGRKINTLIVHLDVNKAQISVMGQEKVEALYLTEDKTIGVGLHCSADLVPAPMNEHLFRP